MQRVILFMAFALTMAISALCSAEEAEESAEIPQRGLTLLDCGTLFGLVSQADSAYSDAMKAFSFAGIGYAKTLIQDPQVFEKETGKSMVRSAEKLPLLQEKKAIFEKELQTCIAELKLAEEDLRPRMSEAMRILVPEIFSRKKSQTAQPNAPSVASQETRP